MWQRNERAIPSHHSADLITTKTKRKFTDLSVGQEPGSKRGLLLHTGSLPWLQQWLIIAATGKTSQMGKPFHPSGNAKLNPVLYGKV